MSDIKIFPGKEEVVKGLTDYLRLEAQGKRVFHVSLSGGSTPKMWFSFLARHFKEIIPWKNIHFWWGDERMVPPNDPESNYGQTQKLLFDHISIPSENIHRVLGELDAEAAKDAYEAEIKKWLPSQNGLPEFDLIILGMGDDGHTASIFPHNMELLEAESICAIAAHPTSGQLRVTKTGPLINNAKKIIFLVTGEGKAEKIQEIHQAGITDEIYPAGMIKAENGELTWMLDQAAANLL